MDSAELDGSSSSPSDNLLQVESVGGTVGGYRVVLEDGSSFFVSTRLFKELSISEGDRLDPEEVSELASLSYRSQFDLARDKALELLARREHTALQLQQKLYKRGFPREVIADVLAQLQDRNELSERRYAEEWLRVRMRRNPLGPAKARATLLDHGVPESIIREVLGEYESEYPDCWTEGAERSVRKMPDRGRISREKAIQRLMRRGFSPSHLEGIDFDVLLG
jgi:regulatory protein